MAQQPEPDRLGTALGQVTEKLAEQQTRAKCVKCGLGPEWQEHLCFNCCSSVHQARAKAERLERRRANIDGHLRRAGVPSRFVKASFEAADAETPVDIKTSLEQWAGKPAGFVFLWGDVGRGKTFLGTAAFRRWFWNDEGDSDAIWVNVLDLWSRLKAGIDGGPEGWDENDMRQLARVPILLVDDIGAEPKNDWARSVLSTLIDARYVAELPTILTSNVDLQTVAVNIDHRTASRISEGALILHLCGAHRRIA
jgi:DNA replication protein DnaC